LRPSGGSRERRRAVHRGHLLVHENDLERLFFGCLDCFAAVGDAHDGVPAVAQEVDQQFAAFESVFGDEDAHWNRRARRKRRIRRGGALLEDRLAPFGPQDFSRKGALEQLRLARG